MRTVTLKCDRCGMEYKPYVSERGNQGFQFFRHLKKEEVKEDGRKFFYSKRYDLCPTCMEEMENWYFDEPDDAPDNEDEIEIDEGYQD